jgi:hypothetical protein
LREPEAAEVNRSEQFCTPTCMLFPTAVLGKHWEMIITQLMQPPVTMSH